MATTLRPDTARRYSGKGSTVAARAAADLGLTAASAQQVLKHLPARLATLITHALAMGRTEAAERMFAPVEAAYAMTPRVSLAAAVAAHHEADTLEELAQHAWLVEPSEANRRKWVSALDREMAATRQLRRALVEAPCAA